MMKFIPNFLTPLSEEKVRSNWWRYGFLAVTLGLVAGHAFFAYTRESYDYFGFIVPIVLLTSHVAYEFRFGERLTISLRIIALLCAVIGLYILVTQ